MIRKYALLLAIITFSCTLATQPPPPVSAAAPCNPGLALVDAAAWVQSSAEYRASAMQVYATAQRMLDGAIADPSWSALSGAPAGARPAIVLDLDETAINNIRFEARMVRKGMTYDPASWSQWINEAAATATPGAAEFLSYAHSRGVTIFYITNRKGTEEAATRRNLEILGYPLEANEDTLLTRGERPEWSSDDKEPRREYVASRFRLLMLFGDDLNDFVTAANKTLEERDRLVAENAPKLGRQWFILPDPMYGSWQHALTGSASGCEQMQKMIDALKP